MLVGPHGAGLTHILHLPRGASVVELTNTPPPQPGRSVANIYRSVATWTGHPYAAVKGAEQPKPRQVASAVCGLLGRGSSAAGVSAGEPGSTSGGLASCVDCSVASAERKGEFTRYFGEL